MTKLIIKNARIIDPSGDIDSTGDIYVSDGVISEPFENADTVIDASGMIAAPGLVDMHVHLRDPGFTEKEDIRSACEAAAAGGVTSLAAMPNTRPVCDSPEVIGDIVKRAKSAKARVYPVAAISKGMAGEAITDFAALRQAGAIAVSDDGLPVSTSALLREAMESADWLSLPLLAHCEDRSLAAGGIINEGIVSAALGVEGSPAAAESVGIARELALAEALGTRVHICHVSTAVSVELIRSAKQRGVKVTAETCPHYFYFNDEMLLHQDADYRMNPPLRGEHDRRAVIRGIIDGTIDVIATDHAPHTRAEKADFYSAPNGVTGLETSLAAGITALVDGKFISMFKLIYMMSTLPAKLLGIPAGSLKIGSAADIVIFDRNEKWIVEPSNLHSKSKNTAFKGLELTGNVKYTILGGEITFED